MTDDPTDDPTDDGAPRDDLPPASALDELASALVDGESTAQELARAGEPEVAARVAELRRVADLVAAPVEPPSEAERNRAVAAALSGFGGVASGGSAASRIAPGADAGDHDLAAARQRREERRDRRPTAAGLRIVGVAAAVIAALAVGAVALQGTGDNEDEDTATASLDTSAGDESGAAEGAEATAEEAGGAAADSTDERESADASLDVGDIDLGDFEDLDQLVAAAGATSTQFSDDDVRDPEVAPSAGGQPAPAGATSPTPPDCIPPDEPVVGLLAARLDGRPVSVVLLTHADGVRVQVFDAASCELLADRPPG